MQSNDGHLNPGSFANMLNSATKDLNTVHSWIGFRIIPGCATTQAVNRQPLTTEAQFRSQTTHYHKLTTN